MEWKTCSFCEGKIEPGCGKKYVKKDGSVMQFCSSKCEKNFKLGRVGRKLKWTNMFKRMNKGQ